MVISKTSIKRTPIMKFLPLKCKFHRSIRQMFDSSDPYWRENARKKNVLSPPNKIHCGKGGSLIHDH